MAMIFLSMAKQYPRTRYGIFRKHGTVIMRTIWQTFRKVALDMGMVEGLDYRMHRSQSERYWEIVTEYVDGKPDWDSSSQIWFADLDETKDPDFNKVKGLELTSAGIDEANEVSRGAFDIVSSRVGRENRNGEPAFVLCTCNPADNWVRDAFYTPWVKDEMPARFLFIPSLPEDNPHNSVDYLASLHAMPVQFRRRYVEGNWDYVDDANALFPNHVLDRMTVEHVPTTGIKRIGVDISREGTDKTVFAFYIGDTLVDLYEPDIDRSEASPISDLIADELILYMKKKNNVGYQNVWIDAVGNGGGVVDSMRRRKRYVNSFKSGERATDLHKDETPKYDMLRSQRYWEMAQAAQLGTYKVWSGCPWYEELKRDLLAHTYEITDKQVLVESKSKMKKRLGRSPDFSDAAMMGWQPGDIDKSGEVETLGSYDEMFDDDDSDWR